MKKPLMHLVFALFFMLLAGGCNEPEPISEEPVLNRILVQTDMIEIAPGEMAELKFTVEDADYSFNFDVNSGACQVYLVNQTGKAPVYYKLSSVKQSGEGTYSAILEDLKIEKIYSDEVRLGIRLTGESSSIVSTPFTVKSNYVVVDNEFKTGLPVVYINTNNKAPITSKDVYLDGTVSINGIEEYPDLEEAVCHIKGRGNTTWSWPKKPYVFKLDEKKSVLGMPKHKRWILLANFLDRTMMRNMVSMHLGQKTSLAWTPHCVPVELVLNGKHVGMYLLIEQVRVDKNRVNINEDKGYLLESDFHYDNKYQWKSYYGKCWQMGDCIPFGIKYPDEEDLTQTQLNYAKNYIDQAAKSLYGTDFKDPEKGYAKYLDVQSYVDYWIVFEMMGNHELSNPGSVYCHFEEGGKIVAGPLWDFDWGVLSYKTSPQAKTGFINKDAIWYARLFKDPAFVDLVQKRWNELLPELRAIPDYMSECEKLLERSAAKNFQMWNPAEDASQNGGSIINGDENMTFHEACVTLRSNYSERLTLLDRLIKNL